MNGKGIINVNGDTFEYSLSGEERPNIVFISGFRMPMSSWEKLFPQVYHFGRIFTYNRLGVGKSSKASAHQTGNIVVDSLRNLLNALDISPPYILVAHSLGGLYANLFARTHPDEVSSIVFVESTHPDEKEKQAQFKPPFLIDKIVNGLKAVERFFDKHKYSEDEFVHETIRQIKAAGPFPTIPIAVVTGTQKLPLVPAESFDVHMQFQQALMALTPCSTRYIAQHSGHFPQISEPEVVLNAINDVAT